MSKKGKLYPFCLRPFSSFSPFFLFLPFLSLLSFILLIFFYFSLSIYIVFSFSDVSTFSLLSLLFPNLLTLVPRFKINGYYELFRMLTARNDEITKPINVSLERR